MSVTLVPLSGTKLDGVGACGCIGFQDLGLTEPNTPEPESETRHETLLPESNPKAES